MKALFVHCAEKLKEDTKGNFYTDGSYSQEVWDRYLSIFGSLSVVFRKDKKLYEESYATQKFQYFDRNVINFIEVIDLSSSYSSFVSIRKRTENNDIIKTAILDHDCLIARLPSSAGYIAINYAKKYNKPYLIEVVGCGWDALWNHSFKGKMLALNEYLKMKKAIKDSPYCIYVTNEFLQRRYKCSGKSIGCSDVSLPHLDESVLEKRLKKISQMSLDIPIVIGTIGAVDVIYKGQEFVIKAISKLNKEGYNFEYHLAGGGDNDYLKSIAEKYDVINKIKFLGSLSHQKVFEYIDNIDIYIQPSKTEGLPRALIEAMSRGCPALGSKIGGIPELLSDEFTFTVGAVEDICKLLRKLNKEVMVKEANRSFDKAKEYDKKLLDDRRKDFYMSFADDINSAYK